MKFYFAPMEGITTEVLRRSLHQNIFPMDRYFTPFIPAAKKMSKKIIRDISPESNPGMEVVPQVMSNVASEVLDLGEQLKAYGYQRLNVNLGCPSGTVTSKKRGSGFLTMPEELDRFLDELYEKTDMQISLKTRIGFYEVSEWEKLVSIYKKYPIDELIIHPRLREEYYNGSPHLEAFSYAVEQIPISLCYNGDIFTVEDYKHIVETFPTIDKVMLGRGVLARPDLVKEIKTGQKATAEELRNYHDQVLNDYKGIMSGDRDCLFKMKEFWSYFRESFPDSDKAWKKIKKTKTLQEYDVLINEIL